MPGLISLSLFLFLTHTHIHSHIQHSTVQYSLAQNINKNSKVIKKQNVQTNDPG